MKVLITGGTGFIGRHVVRLGAARGDEIHLLSSRPTPGGVAQAWAGRVEDASTLRAILRIVRPDTIIHLAASGVSAPERVSALVTTNVLGVANLIDALEELDLRPKLVVAGSGFEYLPGNTARTERDPIGPTTIYGVSKAAASFLAASVSDRFTVVVLRLFNVFGPGERQPRLLPYLTARARCGEVAELTPGEQIRDFVFVEDVAAAFWRAVDVVATTSVETFNIGSGAPIRVRDFAEVAISELRLRGLNPKVTFSRPYRAGDSMYYVADASLARERLGWTATTSISTGIARSIEELLLCSS